MMASRSRCDENHTDPNIGWLKITNFILPHSLSCSPLTVTFFLFASVVRPFVKFEGVKNRNYHTPAPRTSRGLNNAGCHIVPLQWRKREHYQRCRDRISVCLFLSSIPALRSHSDGLSGISEYSWASLKSALLFLEGIHQNSVNFDNPLLSSPHCQPLWCERRGELYLVCLNGKKITKKVSAVNLLSYCSNFLPPSSFFLVCPTILSPTLSPFICFPRIIQAGLFLWNVTLQNSPNI